MSASVHITLNASRSHHGATLSTSTGFSMLVHTDEPKSISAGYDHSLILKQDGSVWVTGWNGNGQLGDGTTTDKYTFEDVIGQYETIAYNISMRRPALLPFAITHTGTYMGWTADSTI